MKSAAAGFPTDGATGQPVRAVAAEPNDTQSPAATQSAYVCPTCDEQACVCWIYDDAQAAFKAEQARRKSSIALCGTCSHTEKAHGSHTGSCLQKMGGRFDGSSDQSRCRCTKFVAAEAPDTLAADLLASLVLAQGKKLTEQGETIRKLTSDVAYLMQAVTP